MPFLGGEFRDYHYHHRDPVFLEAKELKKADRVLEIVKKRWAEIFKKYNRAPIEDNCEVLMSLGFGFSQEEIETDKKAVKKFEQNNKENQDVVKDGKRLEMLSIATWNKFFFPEFHVLHTSKYDDYFGGADLFLLDLKSGEIICAIDTTVDEPGGDRYEEKLRKSQGKNQKEGITIKYGLRIKNIVDPETGKKRPVMVGEKVEGVPLFVFACPQNIMKEAEENCVGPNESSPNNFVVKLATKEVRFPTNDSEKKFVRLFIDEINNQIESNLFAIDHILETNVGVYTNSDVKKRIQSIKEKMNRLHQVLEKVRSQINQKQEPDLKIQA